MQSKFIKLREYLWKQYRNIQKTLHRWFGNGWLRNSDPSQAGEAKILMKIFGNNYAGYLVEIGAHDGSSLSNSSLLIEAGWKALLIEPLPGPFSKLAKKYSQNQKVTCLNIAISNLSGVQKFYVGADGPEGMMSTLCDEDNAWFTHAKSGSAIDVQVDTLTNMLAKRSLPKDFDLLLIDTEGMDYECLLGVDFDQICPRVIVTEIYEWNQEKHAKKETLLRQKGYTLFKMVGCNTIWVKN